MIVQYDPLPKQSPLRRQDLPDNSLLNENFMRNYFSADEFHAFALPVQKDNFDQTVLALPDRQIERPLCPVNNTRQHLMRNFRMKFSFMV